MTIKITLDSNNNVVITKPLDWDGLLVAMSTGNHTSEDEAVYRALVLKHGLTLSRWAFGKASTAPTAVNVDDNLNVNFTYFDPYSATYTAHQLSPAEAMFHLIRLNPCETF